MNTNGHELLYKEEVLKITGCAMEVLNGLGHGLLEKPYENALVVEFGLKGIPVRQQPRYEVRYKAVVVRQSFVRRQPTRFSMPCCRRNRSTNVSTR